MDRYTVWRSRISIHFRRRETAPLACCVLATLACALLASPSFGWGDKGHELITTAAINILPDNIRPFYKANAKYIVLFSALPDDWKDYHRTDERANHYINLDALSKLPFKDLIVSRSAAEKRFGKARLRDAGLLPWVIQAHYEQLVRALRGADKLKGTARDARLVEIAVQSALLSHYVGDAHVPLHATRYYDGKTRAQKGIHGRWEIDLLGPDPDPAMIRPGAPESVRNVLQSAFNWCIASHKLIKSILNADDRARGLDARHSDVYDAELSRLTGPILKGRLTSASRAVAGIYVSAWRQAGKPKLAGRKAPFFWGL